ncbi:MAG: MFS transporter [Patescibacteria group bacterium]
MTNPFKKFHYNVSGYFANHLTQQVKELYASVAIMDFAKSAVMIFEPIYLYTIGFSLQKILIFFLAVYVIYYFCLPLGAKFARRFGYEHGILWSTPCLVLYYLSLFGIAYYPLLIYPAIFFLVLQKSLYWPGYHCDFARFSMKGERGREISNLVVLDSVVYVVGPLLGGLLIKFVGFSALFIVAAVLILVSNIPLMMTKETFKVTPFSYTGAHKRVWQKKHRRKFWSYFGFGEELIVLVIWPIFIYTVVQDYLSIGAIVAGATFFTSLIILWVGRVTDKQDKRVVLKSGTIIYSISWFLRLFAGTGLHVFMIDTLSRVSKNTIYVPMTALTYDRAVKGSVMKEIVFFEMALVIGKIVAILLVLVLLQFFTSGFEAAFIVAGIMTLFYALR